MPHSGRGAALFDDLLKDTPYSIDDPQAIREAQKHIDEIGERIGYLRNSGELTEETLRDYYGRKKFEQVAESNAIEGSTLSVGETELAVLKGTTLTGHDPAYVRDAIALEKALVRLTELAQERDRPTDIEQLRQLHYLIMGERPGGGSFRSDPVRIKGSAHIPPKTREAVLDGMEAWERWSGKYRQAPTPVRAAILHAWLAHIHPFADGNGRAARAISNLELVRAGYPPMIIKRKERHRYIEALSESDQGGDIRSFLELVLERVNGALTGLEISAKKQQDYDPALERIRSIQASNHKIWETSVSLLAKTIQHYATEKLEQAQGNVHVRDFEGEIDLEDYLALIGGQSISRSWCFIINIEVLGMDRLAILAYAGYRTPQMYHEMGDQGGAAIFWSMQNPLGYPRWRRDDEQAPFCLEMTIREGVGDRWFVRLKDGSIKRLSTTSLAQRIATELIARIAPNQ